MEEQFESRLYIVVRNDLFSMNSGKGMAQASHASAQFVYNLMQNNRLDKEWLKQGGDKSGFGTTIVLEGDIDSINALKKETDKLVSKVYSGMIVDKTYPFLGQLELLKLMKSSDIIYDDSERYDRNGCVHCTREETTCYWIYINDEDTLIKFQELCKNNNITLHH